MSRSITVKIATDKVIAMLQTKLAEMDKAAAEYPVQLAKYEKELKTWENNCVKIAVKNASKAVESEASYTRSYNGGRDAEGLKVSLFFKGELFPAKPTGPSYSTSPDNYHFKNDREELEQTIRLLQMHEGDYISTATYKNVSRFL
jgi:hypothetical protein